MSLTPDRDAYLRVGQALSQKHSDLLAAQFSVLRSAVVNFAVEHGEEIGKNQDFSKKFTEICNLIGVDSLELLLYQQSQGKKSPAFFDGLAIRIVEVCKESRNFNGGLIAIKELRSILRQGADVALPVEEDDIMKALGALQNLGKGYDVIAVGGRRWVKFYSASGDGGIPADHKRIYEMCDFMGGYVSYGLLRDNYGWDNVRVRNVIEEMISDGLLWVDSQGDEWLFWEPSWIA